MGRLIDLSGKKFGRWTVIHRLPDAPRFQPMWLCRCDCGIEKKVRGTNLRNGSSKSCGCLRAELISTTRRGPNNPNWRGGRKTRAGYIRHGVWGKKKLEHVLVMERHIGRSLRRGENVHHKNGVRDDNRIGNLELWITLHPKGQRASDKVNWAKKILADYGPRPEASWWNWGPS